MMYRQASLIATPLPAVSPATVRVKRSGYWRQHAIETLHEFAYAKLIRYPSRTGSVPSRRAVTDIFNE